MAVVKPFKAIRPALDKVALVISNSYESYTPKERRSAMAKNALSFLHVIKPGYSKGTAIKGEARYYKVRERYLEFLENNVFMKDAFNSFYIYQVVKPDFQCTGLLAATSAADYTHGVIKKHEDTLDRREKLFANYLEIVKFNAEPVLISHPDQPELKKLYQRVMKNDPDNDFKTPDGIRHKLWAVADHELIRDIQESFEQFPALYIADGHHRSASSAVLASRMSAENPNHTGQEPYNFFMSYLIPETEIRIFDFNRMITDLNGLSKEGFLQEVGKIYTLEPKGGVPITPTEKHEFTMYLDGIYYRLRLRRKRYEFKGPLSSLDPYILYSTILKPILGIKDLRQDHRIHYGSGKHNIARMAQLVDKGDFAVGFGLKPIEVSEIKAIADAGQVMPPKSTYIEPKLSSGLVIYEF